MQLPDKRACHLKQAYKYYQLHTSANFTLQCIHVLLKAFVQDAAYYTDAL